MPELGRTASASGQPEVRELARVYFASAERMGAAVKQAGAELRMQMASRCQFLDFNDPSEKEMSDALAEWRKRLTAELTPTA